MTHECWNEQILWIDLSSQSVTEEQLSPEIYEKFVGGKGLGTYLLYREVNESIDPFDSDNLLLFLSGPLQGLPAPNVGRWTLMTKSPLTGLYLDSHCGGALGRELKKTGYDAVGVRGKANEPVYLYLDDDELELRDAEDIWNDGVYAATEKLHEETPQGSCVYAIGPSGVNLNTAAVGCCEIAHQTGRGGAGAVMGSKNLKAFVAYGTQKIEADDVETIREINRDLISQWRQEGHEESFKNYGTTFIPEISNALGQYPTRNWESGYFEDWEDLDASKMKEKYGLGSHHSCPHCVMRCTHAFRTENPYNPDEEVESMVEYETLGLMGGNLGIHDPQFVFKLNYICDDAGLDTISTGTRIGFAMEAYEKGILTEENIGFPLEFGDGEAALKLAKMIAKREGIGDLLAKGVERASEELGPEAENIAVHVKGLEVPAWDPRGRRGMGVSYATADVGASHLRGWPATAEPPNETAVPTVESMIRSRDEKVLTDSLEVCHFTYRLHITLEQKIAMLNAASGLNYDEEKAFEFAHRVATLSRLFNIREGISRKDDKLPPRFWEAERKGPREGMKAFVTREDFEKSLDKFYELRAWDEEGIPTEETIRDLGLGGIVE